MLFYKKLGIFGVSNNKEQTMNNLMRMIYMEDPKNLPQRIALKVYDPKAAQRLDLLASIWNMVVTALTLASLTNTVFLGKDRQEVLVLLNLGKRMVILRAVRSLSGYPYVLKKSGGICSVDEIDATRFEGLSGKLKEKEIDIKPWLKKAKNALNSGEIEIGGYHMAVERCSRLSALRFSGSYEDNQKVINNVVYNTINYAVACPRVARVTVYKGRPQLTMPVIDADKHLRPELSLVLSFGSSGSIVAVPTILRTDMVIADLRSPDEIYQQAA